MVTHHRMVKMVGIMVGKNDGGIILNTIKHPSIVIFHYSSPFRPGFIGSGCFQFHTRSGEKNQAGSLRILSIKARRMSIKNYSDINQMDDP
jgi:hypothetical protein